MKINHRIVAGEGWGGAGASVESWWVKAVGGETWWDKVYCGWEWSLMYRFMDTVGDVIGMRWDVVGGDGVVVDVVVVVTDD